MEPNQLPPEVRPRVYLKDEFAPKNLTTQPFVPGVDTLSNYDQGLREGMYQPFVRGANQSGIQQIGNALARSVPSIAAKIGEGFAGTISLVSEAAKAAGTGKGID